MSGPRHFLKVSFLTDRKEALVKSKGVYNNEVMLKSLGYKLRSKYEPNDDETYLNVQKGNSRALIRIEACNKETCRVELCLSNEEFCDIEQLIGYSQDDITSCIEKVLPTSCWILETGRTGTTVVDLNGEVEVTCNNQHDYRQVLGVMLDEANARRAINPLGLEDADGSKLRITLPVPKSSKFGAGLLTYNSRAQSMGYVTTRDPDTQELILSTIRDPNEVLLRITESVYHPNIELLVMSISDGQLDHLQALTGCSRWAFNTDVKFILGRGNVTIDSSECITIQDESCSDIKLSVESGHSMYHSITDASEQWKSLPSDGELTVANLAPLLVDGRLTLSGSIPSNLGYLILGHAPDKVWSELVPVNQDHVITCRPYGSGVEIRNSTTKDYISIVRAGMDYDFKISLNLHDFDNQLSYLGIPIKLIRMVISTSAKAMLDNKRDLAKLFVNVPRVDDTDCTPASEARKLMSIGSAGFTPSTQSAEASQTRNLLTVKRAQVLADGFAIQDKIRELQRELEVKNVDLNAIDSAIKSLDTVKHLL